MPHVVHHAVVPRGQGRRREPSAFREEAYGGVLLSRLGAFITAVTPLRRPYEVVVGIGIDISECRQAGFWCDLATAYPVPLAEEGVSMAGPGNVNVLRLDGGIGRGVSVRMSHRRVPV